MNFGLKRQRDVEVNLTPLIDVVFLLLIFFMVSTTFVSQSAIEIRLPSSTSAGTKIDSSQEIEISLSKDGNVFVNQLPLGEINSEKLQAVLVALSARTGAAIVVISADAGVTHQAVITIIDSARKANLRRVTFKTRDNASNKK